MSSWLTIYSHSAVQIKAGLDNWALRRFDLDFFTKCCVLQANSIKTDKNGLPDPLIVILYLKGFS